MRKIILTFILSVPLFETETHELTVVELVDKYYKIPMQLENMERRVYIHDKLVDDINKKICDIIDLNDKIYVHKRFTMELSDDESENRIIDYFLKKDICRACWSSGGMIVDVKRQF